MYNVYVAIMLFHNSSELEMKSVKWGKKMSIWNINSLTVLIWSFCCLYMYIIESVDSLWLLSVLRNKTTNQNHRSMHVRGHVEISLSRVPKKQPPFGCGLYSVTCEVSFLILHAVPRNAAKATRPFPCGIWSRHKTNLCPASLCIHVRTTLCGF